MAWNRNKNSSFFNRTSGSSGGGGTVGGTSSPGGSFGKSIDYTNDSPFGADSNVARPFGGFGMGSGSYNAKAAGASGATGGPVDISSGRKFRPHLYGRRGRTEGSQGGGTPAGGGFGRLAGSGPVSSGASIKGVFSSGAA